MTIVVTKTFFLAFCVLFVLCFKPKSNKTLEAKICSSVAKERLEAKKKEQEIRLSKIRSRKQLRIQQDLALANLAAAA
jgi:hypothetical protein